MLALALSAEFAHVEQLEEAADVDALDEAVAAGLVLVERDRVRPAHPLLAAMVQRRARGVERRKLHLELADIVGDELLRARHLALGTDAPDEEIGATVAHAAAAASARGAPAGGGRGWAASAPAYTTGRAGTPRDAALAGGVSRNRRRAAAHRGCLPSRLEWATRREQLRARAWLLLAEGVHVGHVDDYKSSTSSAPSQRRRTIQLCGRQPEAPAQCGAQVKRLGLWLRRSGRPAENRQTAQVRRGQRIRIRERKKAERHHGETQKDSSDVQRSRPGAIGEDRAPRPR